jgi:hypothetical protein
MGRLSENMGYTSFQYAIGLVVELINHLSIGLAIILPHSLHDPS